MKICLGIAYQGSGFHGWQAQREAMSIQETLETALSKIANEPIRVICAGRTDSGVHAIGQVVHFETQTNREEAAWRIGTNDYLPPSIRVVWAAPVEDDFHARFSAIARRYHFFFYQARVPLPHLDSDHLWVRQALCLESMQEAAQYLYGEQDYSAFQGSGCQADSAVRTLHFAKVSALGGGRFVLDIKANAFLLHMVRNIMGVLLKIGTGEKPVKWLESVIESRDRQQAAQCVSPRGLYFVSVTYPEHYQDIQTLIDTQACQFRAQMGVKEEAL
jgi:tRNA pseudouridine38-40 synthase